MTGDGYVVNVSSLNSVVAFPGNGPYTVSKFALRGFTEILRAEMLIVGHPVNVSCVYPAGVKTPIAKNAVEQSAAAGIKVSAADQSRAFEFARTTLKVTLEKAARVIVDGPQERKPRILIGRDAVLADILARILPGAYPRVIAYRARRDAQQ